MHQILATVIGAVLGALGFIARRLIERDPLTTVINRRLRLISLHQRMKATGAKRHRPGPLGKGAGARRTDRNSPRSLANLRDPAPDTIVRSSPLNHAGL